MTAFPSSNRLTTRPARVQGFTLIELLVVVAIIALLISILLPSLNRARQQAKDVVCQSNLRSIGTALGGYRAESYRGVYPAAVTMGGAPYRILPGEIGQFSKREELYGIAALLEEQGGVPADAKLWTCPRNERDAEFKNTYRYSDIDKQTQNPRYYKAVARRDPNKPIEEREFTYFPIVADNWNLRPYPAGFPKPESKIGNNRPYFIEDLYWHSGTASRAYAPLYIGSPDASEPNDDEPIFKGPGYYSLFLDLSVGFTVSQDEDAIVGLR